MDKVLLISMPFGALERQALGISLLKSGLNQLNIPCDIRYLTFAFAEYIGYDEYQWMSFELSYTAFAGDWTFTHALYEEHSEIESRYVQEILRDTWYLNEANIGRILHIRSLVPHFLAYCMAAIPWEEYAIVGFTSTFEQNIASLALAKQVKKAYPDISIVFGGANWEGEMGQELHNQFQFVDYVCSGEADESFPTLVQRVLSNQPVDCPDPIPGIVYRTGGKSVNTGPANLIRGVDELPIPDFGDYFRDLEQSTLTSSIVPILLIETSRGCWWGAKSHCTFCGLNGGTMSFRSKNAQRALDELEYLVDQWQIDHVEAVDNILDNKYFSTFLPALARTGRPIHLFYEVKANLTREHLQTLREAGVYRIQPGIESLSDHVLKLMRKGTTAVRNIQLMKWCKEYDIGADWNLLYGFPGETKEDYTSMLELLRSIRFLSPPTGYGPIRLDRFSPYYNSSAEYGFVNVRPLAPYQYLYPFDTEILQRIAYYFEYDLQADVNPTKYVEEVIEFVLAWQREPERGTLCSVLRSEDMLVLIDTRSDAVKPEFSLTGLGKIIYEYCDEFHTYDALVRYLHQKYPEIPFPQRQILDMLDSFVANKLMITDGRYYLSLAVASQQSYNGSVDIEFQPAIINGSLLSESANVLLLSELKVQSV
jgi:ribosomal peptide maturation radical SAM protein 1